MNTQQQIPHYYWELRLIHIAHMITQQQCPNIMESWGGHHIAPMTTEQQSPHYYWELRVTHIALMTTQQQIPHYYEELGGSISLQ